MKNVTGQLIDSWFELLDGSISYGGHDIAVYGEDADPDDDSHYIVVKAESEFDDSNKSSFVTNAVVVIDIVTVFTTATKRSVVEDIDNQVRELVFPVRNHNLPALDGLQVTNVSPEGGTYLKEDNGVKKYYRKVTRYKHRVTQI